MRNVFEYYDEGTYLEHHGIRGQKWGVRRFQNPDGSLTPEGQKRYDAKGAKGIKGFDEDAYYRNEQKKRLSQKSSVSDDELEKSYRKMRDNCKTDEEKDRKERMWKNAHDTGRYDIDFLETIQNARILYNDDEKAVLNEYAKFLDHPEEYWEEGRRLPPA